MIKTIYTNTLNILKRVPVKLWGLSLLSGLIEIIVLILGALPIVTIPVIAALSAGMCSVYYKAYINGGSADSSDLFKPFRDGRTFKRTAGGICWMYLWIFLWCLIPLAGPFLAIYKSLSYAFTPYILNEEPEVSGLAALKKSMQETRGLKGKMFLAVVLPVVAYFLVMIIFAALATIRYIGVIFAVIYLILYIVFILAAPLFFGLVEAGFYDYRKKYGTANPYYAPQSGFNPNAAPPYQPYAPQQPYVPQPQPQPAPQPQPEQSDAPVASCPVCGTENMGGKKFCTKCGAKLM